MSVSFADCATCRQASTGAFRICKHLFSTFFDTLNWADHRGSTWLLTFGTGTVPVGAGGRVWAFFPVFP